MADAPLEFSKEKKTPMTDEERVALSQKLDQDLDDFINSMERKKYTDGWSEDTWEVKFISYYLYEQISYYCKISLHFYHKKIKLICISQTNIDHPNNQK